MSAYKEMGEEELKKELQLLEEEYKKICQDNISLDMSRGKPGTDQLELSMGMLDVLNSKSDMISSDGFDC